MQAPRCRINHPTPFIVTVIKEPVTETDARPTCIVGSLGIAGVAAGAGAGRSALRWRSRLVVWHRRHPAGAGSHAFRVARDLDAR